MVLAGAEAYLLRPFDGVDAVLLVDAVEQVGGVVGGGNLLLVDDVDAGLVEGHGHGITIKKLFHLAKQAGISIASNNCQLSFVKRSSAIANSQLKSSPISPAEEI